MSRSTRESKCQRGYGWRRVCSCITILALAALSSKPAFGQEIDRSGFLSANSVQLTSSNYYFAKPNELTIIVNVMGSVQRPGRYEISKSIDLVNLLALAGGASPDGTLTDVKVTRLQEVSGRITRTDFHVNLEDLVHVNPRDLVLSPGDIIQVDRSSWAFIRDSFIVIGTAALVATTVITAVAYSKK